MLYNPQKKIQIQIQKLKDLELHNKSRDMILPYLLYNLIFCFLFRACSIGPGAQQLPNHFSQGHLLASMHHNGR